MADQKKKQIPLRLSAKLYDAVAAWAEDDFRSVNGQIEYLLTECVRQRKKNGKYVSEHLDEHPEFERTVKFISESLDEKDREEFSRQKVIKTQKNKQERLKKEQGLE